MGVVTPVTSSIIRIRTRSIYRNGAKGCLLNPDETKKITERMINPDYSRIFFTQMECVVAPYVPSPLDPLSHAWERGPFPAWDGAPPRPEAFRERGLGG
jgi:hypothetical protein